MTWKIQAITGELTGQEISIDRDMLVGRHQSADIILQAGEISRKHAAFLLKDQALWVQDLNSSNGTFVNDLRIEKETLLKEGDIVQFASLKFSVLAPAQAVELPTEIEKTVAALNQDETVAESAPANAASEAAVAAEEKPKTAAQHMNEQGMPELNQRDSNVQVSRDGMPQGIAIPKPAPIPEGVQVKVEPEPKPVALEQPTSRVELEKTEQKNASLGLISIIVLIILAIIAWLFFK